MHGVRGWLAVTLAAALIATCPALAADLHIRVVDRSGHPLADAIVYADTAAPVPHGKLPRASIDQINRQFVPRVNVVQAGTAVYFPNSDNIRHSVYSFSPAKTFELKLYAGKAAPPVVFDKPGIVVLGCEIHDSMIAWLLVVNTPYFAKSNAQGLATLRNLPSGDYRLRAWHEPMRQATAAEPLHLGPGAVPADITIRIKDNTAPVQGPAMPGMPGMAGMPGMSQ